MARAVHPTGGPFIRHQPPAGAGRRRNHIGPDSGGRPLTTKLLTRQDTPPAVSRPRPAQPESGAEHWRFRRAYCGRAFGYIAYPPRPDGEPTFNEGYVFDGTTSSGGLLPARVVEAPWLTRLQTVGEDVSLVLEYQAGQCISPARRFCPPTTSITTTRCSPVRRSSRRCRAFPPCIGPVCAIAGTARRPLACWSAPTRWTRFLRSSNERASQRRYFAA